MDIFTERIFDDLIVGTASVYTDTKLSQLLGSVERLSFGGKVLGVTGTSPTLTVQVEHSFDGARWMNQNATPEINALALVAPDTFVGGSTASGVAMLNFVRLRISLGGTSPSGVVQLLATGRSPAS